MSGDLTLGLGVTLTGTVTVPGRAVIHGTLEGALTAQDVVVGPEGRVSGTLEADTVELQGEGPATLTARTALVVRATGRVTGTVRYGRLEVEPGGLLQGDLAPLTRAPAVTGDPADTRATKGEAGAPPSKGPAHPGGGQPQGQHGHQPGGKKR
jgi:cytoskeletal protein CcmA (bactofilin family)